MKKAWVLGASGQDGSYMCDLLTGWDYEVTALVRPGGSIRHLPVGSPRLRIEIGDLCSRGVQQKIAAARPDEVYHFACGAQVDHSFSDPETFIQVGPLATTQLLEALRLGSPETRVYHAASSAMFPGEPGQLGATSPYAVAKVATHLMAQLYRDHHGMFVVSGVSYNHESARRPPTAVSMKLACAALRYRASGKTISLGNVDVLRDWHHAKDTVRGAWLALQQLDPQDVVFCSGVARTVRSLAETVFDAANVRYADVVQTENILPGRKTDFATKPVAPQGPPGWDLQIPFEEMVGDLLHGAPSWMGELR